MPCIQHYSDQCMNPRVAQLRNSSYICYEQNRNRCPISKNRQPTAAEVEVLQILWRSGPSSVRDVHELFAEGRDVKYTTTLKNHASHARAGLFDPREPGPQAHLRRGSRAGEKPRTASWTPSSSAPSAARRGRLPCGALGKHKPNKAEIAELKALLNRLEK